MSATIEIQNIGAIRDLVIDLPEDSGGVLVLKGTNRQGKSTAIEIIRALLGKKQPLAVHDEADKGKAEGFGRKLSVTSKTTGRGELEVPSLEGKFDFSDLVLPDGQTAEVRDRIRVKALLSLTGAKADARLFYDLVGGQEAFERMVSADQLKTDDLIELAGRVKRAIDAKAREKESEAQHAENHANSCKLAAGEAKPGDAPDLEALHVRNNAATAELATLLEKTDAARKTTAAVAAATQRLEAVKAAYEGPPVSEAQAKVAEAEEIRTAAETALEDLRRKMAIQEKIVAECKIKQSEARGVLNAASAHEEMVAELTEQIEVEIDEPSANELKWASEDAEEAKHALEKAIVLRDAAKKAAEAKEHEAKAKESKKAAESLRDTAHGVDQALSTALPPGPLRAHKGRVVCDTDRGQGVPFDECSDGEKYRLALPYGIQSVGQGGYLALQQAGYQDLGHEYRLEIAALLQEARVWLITAEVTDGPLRAEVFQT